MLMVDDISQGSVHEGRNFCPLAPFLLPPLSVCPGWITDISEGRGLKQQAFISHGSGRWKSRIKVPEDSGSAVIAFCFIHTVFSLCPHKVEGGGAGGTGDALGSLL